MPYSLDIVVLGRPLLHWLFAMAVGAGVVFLTFLAKAVVARRPLPPLIKAMVQDLRWIVVSAWALNLATGGLALPPRADLYLDRVITVLTCYQIWIWSGHGLTLLLETTVGRRAQNDRGAASALGLLRFLARTALFTLIFLLALHNLGFNITALIAGLGVGGVAVALALQNILGDLFASLTIVLDKPFVVGDLISAGETMGEVTNIGLKSTRLRGGSGEQISIPNSNLLQSRIHNMGRMRRMSLGITLAPHVPAQKLARVPALIKGCIESERGTHFDRAVITRISEWAHHFEANYKLESAEPYQEIHHEIILKVSDALKAEGIEFATASAIPMVASK